MRTAWTAADRCDTGALFRVTCGGRVAEKRVRRVLTARSLKVLLPPEAGQDGGEEDDSEGDPQRHSDANNKKKT